MGGETKTRSGHNISLAQISANRTFVHKKQDRIEERRKTDGRKTRKKTGIRELRSKSSSWQSWFCEPMNGTIALL